MYSWLGNLVSRRWLAVLLGWLAIVVGIRIVAPSWDDVTHDGDFAYLPDDRPSVIGERLSAEAFPDRQSKSQIVVMTVREDGPLTLGDIGVGNDLARRFCDIQGAALIDKGRRLLEKAELAKSENEVFAEKSARQMAADAFHNAVTVLDEAIQFDRQLAEHRGPSSMRLASAYHNQALAYEHLGKNTEAADQRAIAHSLDPALKELGAEIAAKHPTDWPLVDMWTWQSEVIGGALTSEDNHARLIVLLLSNEFLATDNVRLLGYVQAELNEVRGELEKYTEPGLFIGVSGSAAVGGDILAASRDSMRNTELFTFVLVILILSVVYRSPLLVAVPLITITVSFMTSTSLVALLTQLSLVPGFGWWDLKVFTTSKIFIVVILFGAGTDFCLFLISRYREELDRNPNHEQAVAKALEGVGDALTASALTTILGLSMMYFADFGKLSNSGPVIGLCLAVTLLACMTLAPAMLRAFGRAVFWPFASSHFDATSIERADNSRLRKLWEMLARLIVDRPGLILVTSVLLLLPLAGYGYFASDHVTYDLLSSLSEERPSRQGAETLRRHFNVGESGPVVVLAQHPHAHFLPLQESDDAYREKDEIWQLTAKLYQIPGVNYVRSYGEPLGKKPVRSNWREKIPQQSHPFTKALYITQVPKLQHNVTRFEVILEHDAFSIESMRILGEINVLLDAEQQDEQSFWHGASFSFAGVTAAIRDLRQVTQSDNRRIQILVVVAVFAVLLMILRRPLVCAYMILSVLFSYFVTIGVTELFFGYVYGASYQGLDWKVPLFLFVILVAIGQDYNVYLATRVFEEQSRLGPFAGLRRAVVQTGGIITSCGVIMAGTFISMTAGTWGFFLPDWIPFSTILFPDTGGSLRGIVELGFALALGVMLDTFIVRPILVPAFLALLCRWRATSTRA